MASPQEGREAGAEQIIHWETSASVQFSACTARPSDCRLHVFDSYFPDLPRKSETQSQRHMWDASADKEPKCTNRFMVQPCLSQSPCEEIAQLPLTSIWPLFSTPNPMSRFSNYLQQAQPPLPQSKTCNWGKGIQEEVKWTVTTLQGHVSGERGLRCSELAERLLTPMTAT